MAEQVKVGEGAGLDCCRLGWTAALSVTTAPLQLKYMCTMSIF